MKDPHQLGSSSEWTFIGEGGANIVFGYSGVDAGLMGRALRIRKHERGALADASHLIEQYGLASYADPAEVVALDAPFVDGLLRAALPYREGHRLKFPDRPGNHGLLYPNYHGRRGDTDAFYSIEIKPKWIGALAYVSGDDCYSAQHHNFCRFCNHNYSLERVTSQSPRYCPADLFSGSLQRIKHAVECLCQEPRNNLRAFHNGSPMLAHRVPVAVRSRLSQILAVDGFLQFFRETLLSTWTTVVEGCASDAPARWRQLLKEAVMLRDCSFIVGLTPGTLQYQINLIDLDHKHDEKMDYYVSEVGLLKDLLRKC